MTTEVGPAAAAGARPDGRRSRWTQHRVERRAAFVAAGADAIDLHGPEASAEQIAELAGVSRTVLYRYFRDREDLRQAIADHVVMAVTESVLPKLAISPQSTPRDIITTTIATIIDWLGDHPNLYYFLRTLRNGSSLDVVENTLAVQVAALLKILMLMFGIDDEQAEPGAHGLVGFVEATGSWWLKHQDEMPRERIIDLICGGVWNLLQGSARAEGITIHYDEPLPIGPAV
ncbi:MAG: TetR/AcrR family transcriptional regulator [Jatrophihabitans sp.]|uniref:TetR/AcrR family transcriptional regulator n=1 Tax=Jatrophihabitans sp. TaxID=1932789 RepID=UPI003F7EBE79